MEAPEATAAVLLAFFAEVEGDALAFDRLRDQVRETWRDGKRLWAREDRA